jgi:hypothetical protein
MAPIVLYHSKTNNIVVLEPNVGEYWMNFRIITRSEYEYPTACSGYYDGNLASFLDAGYEIVGDF